MRGSIIGMENSLITVGQTTLAVLPSGDIQLGHKAHPTMAVMIESARLERWVMRILRDETFVPATQKPAGAAA